MAIRTTNVAARDLDLELCPGQLIHQSRDGRALGARVAMIEVRDDRIGLAAVNTQAWVARWSKTS